MLALINRLPLLVTLMAIGAGVMIFPAIHSLVTLDIETARIFFYSALLFGFLTSFLAIALSGRAPSNEPGAHLLSLLGLFVVLPFMLAVPFYYAAGTGSYLDAYTEMVSSLTTTGATLYDPSTIPDSAHLWRALVGWLGGLVIWVGAIAVLAPIPLGGFEVYALAPAARQSAASMSQITRVADMAERIRSYTAQLFPIYAGLTIVLWIALIVAGDDAFVAFCHALSTLSTSGISPVGGVQGGQAGFAGEALVALFFVFAVTRLAFTPQSQRTDGAGQLLRDPEVRFAGFLLVAVPLALFVCHWLGAYQSREHSNFVAGALALWGSLFTTFSFLTTTGFASAAWDTARDWSGLTTPGLVLAGLAMVGGGVATTAGGAKLLRVYALYKHGVRELERLVHPNSVGGAGGEARHIRRRGAYLSWIFVMLMIMSFTIVMMVLSLFGVGFEPALILSIAALTTTGPLADVAGATPISYGLLGDAAKLTLAVAMVLGRLETLAIIALLNPETWRR